LVDRAAIAKVDRCLTGIELHVGHAEPGEAEVRDRAARVDPQLEIQAIRGRQPNHPSIALAQEGAEVPIRGSDLEALRVRLDLWAASGVIDAVDGPGVVAGRVDLDRPAVELDPDEGVAVESAAVGFERRAASA